MKALEKRELGAGWAFFLVLMLGLGWTGAVLPVPAQQAPAGSQAGKPGTSGTSQQGSATHITPEEAQKLFGMVDELLKFSSQETGLPIKQEVQRKLTTRAAVEAYLREKLNDDQDAKRMQRSEIVLKKFGLLDRDFDLKPFLLQLLGEQIEAYYDPKTKTVNLLDWVKPEEQKSVLAHELTHALQDQHVNLDKWGDQTPEDVSTDAAGDTDHLARDEMDSAREAVSEGQATAVMLDDVLKPMGRSLLKDPEVVEMVKHQMTSSDDSPVMARAPLLLSESLLFPYREGLSFEQDVWMDKGRDAAFAGTLDRPPSSTWEIINPREYEMGHRARIPLLPNIHPLVDAQYKPYDIGQVGELDVQILSEIFADKQVSRDLTPAWDGGIYWAGQQRNATVAEQAGTKSVALFYLSIWRSPESAQQFAAMYAGELGRQFSGLKEDHEAERSSPQTDGEREQVYATDEGPVVLTTRGKMVFVSETFDLALARKLAELILDAQGTGSMQLAKADGEPVQQMDEPRWTLTGSMVRFLAGCGAMKAAVDPALRTLH